MQPNSFCLCLSTGGDGGWEKGDRTLVDQYEKEIHKIYAPIWLIGI